MKLYYTPGTCAFAPHTVANELGIKLDLVKVDLGKKTTSDGKNFLDINPKGYVPALELDDGRILTEGPAISLYLADLHPEKNLAHKCGTFERAEVTSWLSYISTELHKNFSPLYAPASSDTEKQAARDKLAKRFALVEQTLEKASYLVSNQFSAADAYLFTVLGWCDHLGIALDKFPSIQRYIEELTQRESIIAAKAAEKAG
ncbi:MAG: Glutathione S-transferase domain-containing protein [Candidatus Tokpelaia hoelldobleri]|uniref:Glutathione S-transferase domain-containing protein n=1 Tax=Candidatus Tokpelaia hoelldobleri TaxID=1902579 RepID=A0A1U9JV89_9HYPH|nr:MAG: Glutathione S-transferase domain-containing protein [Candidatus Tokpelaia hoelldoblerii]